MDSIETPEATKRCKQCGSHEILPVVYGLPTAETLARAALGEVLLGGCVVLGDEPDWRCAKCGAPFDIAEFAPDGYKSCSSNSKLGVRKISQTIPTHLKRLRQKIHDPQRIPAAYLRNDNRINDELAITLESIEPGTFPVMQI
jgi:hypothetical protein